jgi:hypothetical protein
MGSLLAEPRTTGEGRSEAGRLVRVSKKTERTNLSNSESLGKSAKGKKTERK